MIVPGAKGGMAPQTEMPSEANMLMALSEMKNQGRFDNLGAQDQNNPKDPLTARGDAVVLQEVKQTLRKSKFIRPNVPDEVLTPGESVTDRVLGPTSKRDVRGD